ncbi:diacylglycerol kinase family protein [Conexibacter sp. DBS9H8]|uniref:diacylglycerol/lipid kinase family protein n=1 Tax=Conexibacter sp. DBS9H8 TaxID=2937801 RepID=UPI00200EC347|nr:diacylglycerol kinase family protein [Conexibacter sp. DBS9H8]
MAPAVTDSPEQVPVPLVRSTDAPPKRLLVIVNPYATTVSDRLRNLVVYALRGSYQVDAVDTERRLHATELCREAARAGYDLVVAFGGDGTVNEAANGLAGSGVPLTCLPGGRVNVYCRALGIPADVVDATEHLLGLADDWHPRRVDLGRVNDRYFVINAGVGLDASVVEQVDAHPRLKSRWGEYYYATVATSTFLRRYLRRPPRMTVTFDALGPGAAADARLPHAVAGVTTIVQNGTPYTYFGRRPIELAPGATLDSGDLAGVVLKRTTPVEVPTVSWRILSATAQVGAHRQVDAFAGISRLTVASQDGRALPIQVDGDYIGTADEAVFTVAAGALTVLA